MLAGLLTACARPQPHIVQGVLDLRGYDLEQAGPVQVSGEAEFYWGQLLTPADFQRAALPQPTGYIAFPRSWNGYLVNGAPLGGDGYATYRFKILLDQAPARLGLKLMAYETAYRLYVNGELLGGNGVVGTTPQTMRPEWRPQAVVFETSAPTVEVVIQFSNFYHRKGGPEEPLSFGTQAQIQRWRERSLVEEYILFGGLFIMGVYHVGLFTLRRRDRSPLYFGLTCLLMALRIPVTDEYFLSQLVQAIDWRLVIKLNYLCLGVVLPLFAMYTDALFPGGAARWQLRGLQLAGTLWGALVIFTPARIFTYGLPYYQIVILVGGLYVLYLVLRAWRYRQAGAVIFLAGFLFLLVTTVNDILHNNHLIQTGYLGSLGMFVFAFVQAAILSRRFADAFTQVEALTHDLEQRVEERTLALSASNQELAAMNLALQQEIQQREAAQESQRRHDEQLRLLHEIDQRILAASSPETIATALLNRIRALIPCQRVTVLALTPQGEVLLLAGESDGTLPPAPIPEVQAAVAREPALHGGYILGADDLAGLPRRSPWQERLYEQGICAYLFVPLQAQRQLIGLLMFEATQPGAFVESHVTMAQDLGSILAVAIHQARLFARVQQELAERKQAEAKLRQLSQAVEQSASTVVITDLNGAIEYVNPAFTTITGYSAEEALGRNPRILSSGHHSREFYSQMWQTILRGEVWQGEVINRRKDGELYWEATTISPVRDEAGRITHFVAVKEDISRRKATEAALHRRTQELEASNAELDAFAHTVAHDLKTPLTIIMGFGELLRTRAARMSPEDVDRALAAIIETGQKMSSIINELLLLASMRKMDQVAVGRLDMGQIVAEVQKRLQFQIAETGAELVLPETWPVVIGYAPWVEEVWVNYISNALKYGGRLGEGIPPRVELGWEWGNGKAEGGRRKAKERKKKEGETVAGGEMAEETGAVSSSLSLSPSFRLQPAFVRFWVRDNGPGLTPEQRARLFGLFTRLDQTHVEGHGLGLSIVRRIVEKLGGEVGVESEVGVGSTFYFTLPAAEPREGS